MRQGSGNSESQRHTESTKPGPVRGWYLGIIQSLMF